MQTSLRWRQAVGLSDSDPGSPSLPKFMDIALSNMVLPVVSNGARCHAD